MTKSVGIEEARVNLAELLMRTRYKGEQFVITKNGKPLALVTPIDNIPTLQPRAELVLEELTPAQKRWGALARMIPSDKS